MRETDRLHRPTSNDSPGFIHSANKNSGKEGWEMSWVGMGAENRTHSPFYDSKATMY